MVLKAALRSDKLRLEDYPEALRAALDFSEYGGVGLLQEVQVSYVGKLIAAKRENEALLESKRLLGITPLDGQALSRIVSTIGATIKADVLAKDKTLPQAIEEANAYLEAVNKGDVKKHSYSALTYPTTSKELEAFASDARPRTAIVALLYAVRFEEAKDQSKTLLAMAGDNDSLARAIQLAGAALNGESGLPTTANVLLQPKAE